jgi:protease I
MNNKLDDKKIAMIIAFRDFQDLEYFISKQVLRGAGIRVITVSTSLGIAIGADGGEAKVDLLLENLNPQDFDGIVFIGGGGCLKYLDNDKSYAIIQETIAKDRVLGAICISPVISAKAGVLKGKKATVWSSLLDKSPVKVLKETGADYQDEGVVIDGKIVTANGPPSAKAFGEALVRILE